MHGHTQEASTALAPPAYPGCLRGACIPLHSWNGIVLECVIGCWGGQWHATRTDHGNEVCDLEGDQFAQHEWPFKETAAWIALTLRALRLHHTHSMAGDHLAAQQSAWEQLGKRAYATWLGCAYSLHADACLLGTRRSQAQPSTLMCCEAWRKGRWRHGTDMLGPFDVCCDCCP